MAVDPGLPIGADVIGLSSSVPPACDPIEFRQLVGQGRSSISTEPPYHWLGSSSCNESECPQALRYGAFLEEAFGFDAPFYGICHGEAEKVGLQHRLVLQLAWPALEGGCIVPHEIADRSVEPAFVALHIPTWTAENDLFDSNPGQSKQWKVGDCICYGTVSS
jgi:Beta-ketoacyl synthase, N-terminal domain